MRSCVTRREFLRIAAAGALIPALELKGQERADATAAAGQSADYTLHIRNVGWLRLGKNRFVSTTTYNGECPGPVLRLRGEGERTTIEIHNETDTPEQLHWHGQNVPVDVDGAAEEGTPFVAAGGMRRVSFVPQPSGLRFYHTHVRAGGD